MIRVRYQSNLFSTGLIIFFLSFLLSSCVYEKEFSYTNDQINSLNVKTSQIQDSIDERLAGITSGQADIMVEIDSLKENIRELSGRIEDNEHIIKNVIEKDLSEQDAILADLEKLAELSSRIEKLETVLGQQQEYLGLEPIYAIDEPEDEESEFEASLEEAQTPEESEQYDYAYSLFREGRYEQASEVFKGFLSDYPESDLADNAQFWIGECHMAQKQYEQAILAYQEVIKNYPKGNKVPNAMWRQALAFLEVKDGETSSKLLLKKIIKEFPDSDEAKLAETKLKNIK